MPGWGLLFAHASQTTQQQARQLASEAACVVRFVLRSAAVVTFFSALGLGCCRMGEKGFRSWPVVGFGCGRLDVQLTRADLLEPGVIFAHGRHSVFGDPMGAATTPPIPVCRRRRLIYEMLLLGRASAEQWKRRMTLCRTAAVSGSGAGVAEQQEEQQQQRMPWHGRAGVCIRAASPARPHQEPKAQEPPTKRGGIFGRPRARVQSVVALPVNVTPHAQDMVWCWWEPARGGPSNLEMARSPWSPFDAWAWDRARVGVGVGPQPRDSY